MGETHISEASKKLAVLVPLFRPLADLCIKHSFFIQDVFEALKIAFIQAAQDELRSKSEKINVSRLSITTGLRRREVNRLFLEKSPKSDELDLVTKVIGLWTSGREFT